MWVFIRYAVVAVLIYVLDMGGYYLLLKAGLNPVIGNIIAKIVAAICGFFMHRRFTYQIKDASEALAHAKKYFGLAILYTPVSSITLYLLMLIIPNPIWAKGAADVLLVIVTFWLTTKFTFSRKKDFSVKNDVRGRSEKL